MVVTSREWERKVLEQEKREERERHVREEGRIKYIDWPGAMSVKKIMYNLFGGEKSASKPTAIKGMLGE